MRPLLIGLGNPDRGDDGVGLLVARDFPSEEMDVCLARGEATELLALLQGRKEVYLVDCVRSGAPPGTLHRFQGELPRTSNASTHGMGLSEAVGLARVLGCLPEKLVVLGIEGLAFEPGTPVSPAVLQAVPRAVQALLKEAR